MLQVEFTTKGRAVTHYSLVLLVSDEGLVAAVRAYDAAHGFNEMHRYTADDGKQQGESFHAGTLGEGMRAAISEIQRGYGEMIEGWRR